MDYSSLLERLRPHWLPIMLGMAGLMFLVYGLTTLSHKSFGNAQDKPDILFEAASDVSPLAKEAENKQLTVDVSGAVENPGVYDLPSDARVQDALIAAGGMSEEADREKVAKGLNLAAKLSDGGKVYIPAVGDPSAGSGLVSAGQTVLGSGTSASGIININSASTSELDKLQGVGQVTAEKIISNRPYGSIEELVSKKVVSQKVFEQIKSSITVY